MILASGGLAYPSRGPSYTSDRSHLTRRAALPPSSESSAASVDVRFLLPAALLPPFAHLTTAVVREGVEYGSSSPGAR